MTADLPIEEGLVLDVPQAGGIGALAAEADPTARVLHTYGERVKVVGLPTAALGGPGVASSAVVTPEVLGGLSETEQLGVLALQLRQSTAYAEVKHARPRQGEQWDMRGGCLEQDPMAGTAGAQANVPRGAPTSAYLEGKVAVGVILVEGPTAALQFSAAERTKVVAEVQAGLSYLATANPIAGVSFSYDVRIVRIATAATAPAADQESRWRDPAMAALGYPAAWGSVDRYVRDIRTRLGTRWAFAAFFTKYPVRHFAYASIGGPRVVMDYANGSWGPDNIDRVFAHETGHIFGAPDEYASSNCDCGGAWGRFGRPNVNCERCAPGGGHTCLMKRNDWAMCQATPAHLGWMPSRMIAKHSLKVVDIHGGSGASGAFAIQWPLHGGHNQAFRADPVGGGYYRLVALHSTKVLDVHGGSTANGARLLQWDWHGGDNQLFRLEPLGDGYVRIVAKHSGRVLDVHGHSTADSAPIIQWDYHGGPNQRWLMAAASTSASSGKVLDVQWGSTGAGANLIQWDYHGGGNQTFRYEAVGGGFHRIVAHHSGLVLDVHGGSTANGARLLQWPWHGGDNQRFRVQPLGDGTVRILAKHSGRVLDVHSSSPDNGAAIIQWDWHGGDNQRFLVPQIHHGLTAVSLPAAMPEQRAADSESADEPLPAGSG
jgi:hypothetical protein